MAENRPGNADKPGDADGPNGSAGGGAAPEGQRVPVVGIGASAGGLAAAEDFFRGLPPRPGMASVVIQHLAPDHESEPAELLQNRTTLPISQVEDGQRARANHVHTIPPGRQLTSQDRVLQVTPAEGKRVDGVVHGAVRTDRRSTPRRTGHADRRTSRGP